MFDHTFNFIGYSFINRQNVLQKLFVRNVAEKLLILLSYPPLCLSNILQITLGSTGLLMSSLFAEKMET